MLLKSQEINCGWKIIMIITLFPINQGSHRQSTGVTTRYTVHGRGAKSPLGSEYRLKTRSKKFKLFFKKVFKNGPKSGSKPVRFPTVIHKVACFWTVFSKTFICGLSNLHCSVPCVTRTYPQYRNSRKSVTDRQTDTHTHTLTGHPVFDSPTNVRALRAKINLVGCLLKCVSWHE